MARSKAADGVREHANGYVGGTGEISVLLCHGFTGSPWSMLPWAKHLEAAGLRVSLPLLPGHGTDWRDLNGTKWTQWYDCVEREYEALAAESRLVFVAGLSMGGTLALRLAEHHDVAGLVLVNPLAKLNDPRLLALPVLRHLIGHVPSEVDDIAMPEVSEYGYYQRPLHAVASMLELCADVRSNLSKVTAPLILFRSVVDHVLDPGSAKVILAGVSSTDVKEQLLQRSYHVATLDYDAPEIFATSVDFIRSRSGD